MKKSPYLCNVIQKMSLTIKNKIMVTIKFINVNGKGQMTVKDSQKENVINSLLAVGYGILGIEQ